MNLKNTKLSKTCNLFYIQNKSIVSDIILYGSYIRGNAKPNDLDILLIFKTKINKNKEYELRKELEHIDSKISILSKTIKTFKEKSFVARESIFIEGYSLLRNNYISSDYGLVSKGIFMYKTKQLTNTKKTRFYYALNGRRSSKGVLEDLECIKLSDNIILTPLNNIDKLKEFFLNWDIEYILIPSTIPIRLNKKHILGKFNK